MLAALAYSTADALVRLLPERDSERAARALARILFHARVPARARLERNLARLEPLGPRPARQRARQTFEQFGLAVADFLRLAHVSDSDVRRRVVVHGARHLESVRRLGRGCIVVSVHAGCWEWGAAFLAACGIPIRVLAAPHRSRIVERFFRRHRSLRGVRALDHAPAWVEAASVLRRGEWVAVMGDRAIPGLKGSLCGWASALALRTGAVLLPVTMTRLPDGRHALWCERPLTARESRAGALSAAVRRHVALASGQWFAFQPLPDGLA